MIRHHSLLSSFTVIHIQCTVRRLVNTETCSMKYLVLQVTIWRNRLRIIHPPPNVLLRPY